MGAADAKGSGQMGEGASAYELVMAQEEQIDFIKDEMVAGTLTLEAAQPAKKPTQQQTLAEVRRRLDLT